VKKLLVGAFLSVLLASGSGTARAQHMIGGMPVYCNDFRGIPVTLIANPALNDVGMATLGPAGQPVMILNPTVVGAMPPAMQLFWYGHECAHHALGHIARRGITNEAEADCWAVRTGRQQGWFPPQAFQYLIAYLGNSPGSAWGHLPGPARVQNMMACYQG
jgi:hypothetical protein